MDPVLDPSLWTPSRVCSRLARFSLFAMASHVASAVNGRGGACKVTGLNFGRSAAEIAALAADLARDYAAALDAIAA